MTVEFKVTGFEELAEKLLNLSGPEAVDSALRRGLLKGGTILQGAAKKECPVDTGYLRNSIAVTEEEDGVDVGTDVEYGIYVEFGTGALGDPSVTHTNKEKWVYFDTVSGGFKTGYPQPPRPFLYPALRLTKDDIKKAVKDEIRNELDGR